MREIKVFQETDQEVKGDIVFETVVAGESTTRKLYILNIIRFPINIELTLLGDHIYISKSIKNLKPEEKKEVEFILNPSITLMKPITAKLNIKISYVVR